MKTNINIRVEEDTKSKLQGRAKLQGTDISELLRPVIEAVAEGTLSVKQPEPQNVKQNPPEALEDVKQAQRKAFRLLPWDHDDHLRPRINTFRQRVEDRDAKWKAIRLGLKGIAPGA